MLSISLGLGFKIRFLHVSCLSVGLAIHSYLEETEHYGKNMNVKSAAY